MRRALARPHPSGTVYEVSADFIDVPPTVASATGCAVPADRPIDGIDLFGNLRHRSERPGAVPHD